MNLMAHGPLNDGLTLLPYNELALPFTGDDYEENPRTLRSNDAAFCALSVRTRRRDTYERG